MVATVGTGVAIGVVVGGVVLLTLFIFAIGILSMRREEREMREQEAQHREELRARHEREQRQWRERRLRDVVLLLVERGEACEGIPLAVQLPGKSEVSCRRRIRRAQPYSLRDELEEELRAEAEARLPEEVRRVMYQSLPELLAGGRPPEAGRGPDIMQMLLDGQEPRALSSSPATSDEEWTSTATPTATPPTTPQPTSPTATPPPPPAAPDPHAQWAAERQAAIIRELHAERDHQRRRRTADEVYGEGYAYVANPENSNVTITVTDAFETSAFHSEAKSIFRHFIPSMASFRARSRARSSANENYSLHASSRLNEAGCREPSAVAYSFHNSRSIRCPY